jgi:hypothetical protein
LLSSGKTLPTTSKNLLKFLAEKKLAGQKENVQKIDSESERLLSENGISRFMFSARERVQKYQLKNVTLY